MNYGTWTLAKLQSELRTRGARPYGRKKELVERLEALDSMGGCKTPRLPTAPPPSLSSLPWPEASAFKSLVPGMQEDLPDLTRSMIENYVSQQQGRENEPGCSNSFKQGSLLAEEKVHGMSVCKQDQLSFFTGLVEAAYKKNLFYGIKIVIDFHGNVQNSSCDCPAGAGSQATCKHIIAGEYSTWYFS